MDDIIFNFVKALYDFNATHKVKCLKWKQTSVGARNEGKARPMKSQSL